MHNPDGPSCDFLLNEQGVTDCHTHIFESSRDVPAPRHPHPEEAATLAHIEEVSAGLGVDRYVLTQPSFLGFDNYLVMNALAARPKDLRGVVWLDETHDPDALSALAAQGVAGLRFPMFYAKSVPDWRAYSALLKAAAQFDIHVELGLAGHELMNAVYQVLDHGAQVVVAHLGAFDRALGPDQDPAFDALLEAAQTGRVWLKLSAPYRSCEAFADRACERILETIGPERTVWGSDWPHIGPKLDRQTTYGTVLNWLCRIAKDDSMRRQIFVKSPETLYGFTPTHQISQETNHKNGEDHVVKSSSCENAH